MSKNRYINTRFWSDNFVVELNPLDRYLFLYFLTNERTNICGIYELPLRTIAFETGIEIEMLKKMLARLSGRIYYVDGWVYIKNFAKHQKTNNKKIEKGIENALLEVPAEIMQKIKDSLSKPIDSLSKPIDSLSKPIDSLSKPIDRLPIGLELYKLKLKPKPKPKLKSKFEFEGEGESSRAFAREDAAAPLTPKIKKTERSENSKPTPAEIAREFFATAENEDGIFQKVLGWVEQKGVPQKTAKFELKKFAAYWTEPTNSGQKQLWETKKTFELSRRVSAWLQNSARWNTSAADPPRGGLNLTEL